MNQKRVLLHVFHYNRKGVPLEVTDCRECDISHTFLASLLSQAACFQKYLFSSLPLDRRIRKFLKTLLNVLNQKSTVWLMVNKFMTEVILNKQPISSMSIGTVGVQCKTLKCSLVVFFFGRGDTPSAIPHQRGFHVKPFRDPRTLRAI